MQRDGNGDRGATHTLGSGDNQGAKKNKADDEGQTYYRGVCFQTG